ncbi:hypothetical protein GMRT_11896 [Giardia muris]|uniref:Uncharacterized protein n=1 Tax=Giardia muris TaxID=5742 RepID=A0A4Z1T7G6_GIAMU|nr:hypothetical protein GMRT_11896 [Giardia muris]|eukprot:TNJ28509.1 hypothetical protein GMRT_11896 [Giardia muris]
MPARTPEELAEMKRLRNERLRQTSKDRMAIVQGTTVDRVTMPEEYYQREDVRLRSSTSQVDHSMIPQDNAEMLQSALRSVPGWNELLRMTTSFGTAHPMDSPSPGLIRWTKGITLLGILLAIISALFHQSQQQAKTSVIASTVFYTVYGRIFTLLGIIKEPSEIIYVHYRMRFMTLLSLSTSLLFMLHVLVYKRTKLAFGLAAAKHGLKLTVWYGGTYFLMHLLYSLV